MIKTTFEPKNNQKSKLKDLFLLDPKSDFLLILSNRIYPLHQEALLDLPYFIPIINSKNKVHVI